MSLISRRGLLRGLGFIAAAPAIVRVSSLMKLPRPVTELQPPLAAWVDLGVTDVETGLQLIRVPAAPLGGQYSFDERSGVYSFNAADGGRSISCTRFLPVTIDIGSGYTMRGPVTTTMSPYVPRLD